VRLGVPSMPVPTAPPEGSRRRDSAAAAPPSPSAYGEWDHGAH
jgi:hypothetical protein